MSKELSPKYNPAEVEAGRYQKWLDADVFKPSGDQKAKPYSIVIPPPNVTGKLYLNRSWSTTFKVNESQSNWDFPFKPVSEVVRISNTAEVEFELLKNELEEKIDS